MDAGVPGFQRLGSASEEGEPCSVLIEVGAQRFDAPIADVALAAAGAFSLDPPQGRA
jgi:hypothetical protein